MNKLLVLLVIVLGLSNWSVFSQTPVSKNMVLLNQYKVDTFPIVFAGRYSDCWGYTAPDGREYAILGSTPYIHFFDITDGLVEITQFQGGGNSLWREFKSYKNRIYAVADQGNEGIMIFDMSNAPSEIILRNQIFNITARTHMPFIDEKNGRLYLAGTSAQNNGLMVLDLTKDPDNPTLLASVPLPGGYIHDVHVKDNIAYCSHGFNGLWVYDFTIPTAPVLLGNMTVYPEAGYNHSTWLTVDEDYLIQCDESHDTGVKLVNIKDLTDIKVDKIWRSTLLAPADLKSLGHNPYVRGDKAIISYYQDGVQIYDISNYNDIKNIAYYDTDLVSTSYTGFKGCWGVFPFFPSEKLILSDLIEGLFVVKLDGISLAPVPAPTTPNVTLNYSGEVRICEGESFTLTAPASAQFINWYKGVDMINSSDLSLEISEPGDYKFVAWNQGNVAESSIVNVIYSTAIKPIIEIPAGKDYFCEGESLVLCNSVPNVNLEWSLDNSFLSETSCISIIEGGVYSAKLIDGLCVLNSDPVNIEKKALPLADIVVSDTSLCTGETAQLSLTSEGNDVSWVSSAGNFSDKDNVTIQVTQSGTYTPIVFGAFCTFSGPTYNIVFYDYPIISIDKQGSNLIATPGFTYKWLFNGILLPTITGNTCNIIGDGTYTVIATNIGGCSTEESFSITSTIEPDTYAVKIFPNPISENLTIEISGKKKSGTYKITNALGQVIRTGNLNDSGLTTLNLTNLPDGIYFLDAAGDASFSKSFTKYTQK